MDQTIRFDDRGLVPCVVQDWATGEVLTLAYMDAEALERTRATGETHFHSRSRDELWHKGETSGNVQRVRQLRYDCDADAVVALVEPAGPACHTGERGCFYREVGGSADGAVDGARAEGEPAAALHETLPALERTLADRASTRPQGSYTVALLDDPELIGAKVQEEAEEVSRAAREESDQRVAEEAADLLYHLEVLLASRGLSIEAALAVLNDRRG
jgi:phosphoribosyl-ATP pyrophosphohydrolase/phosphoribosyl-AMP cyclohydrolase